MNKKSVVIKFLLLFLLPAVAFAQQDFDYTLNTRHSQMSQVYDKDSSMAVLALERRIVKQGGRIFVTSTGNTADEEEYKIKFLGVKFGPVPKDVITLLSGTESMSFEYVTEDGKYRISTWPMIPIVEIYLNCGPGPPPELFKRYF